MTAVKYEMVMESCIDGPSHKWAIQLVISHGSAPIVGSRDCAVTAPSFPSQNPPPPPPPTIEDDHLEYEVEAILNVKKVGWGVKYLVKWLGHPVEENTWEPCWNLSNVTLMLRDFFQQHLDKVKLAGQDAQP